MLLRTPNPMLLHLIAWSQLLLLAFCKDVNQAGIHFVHPKTVTWGNDHVDASNNILWALPNTSTTYHNNIKSSTFGAIFMQSVAGSLIDVLQGGHLSIGKFAGIVLFRSVCAGKVIADFLPAPHEFPVSRSYVTHIDILNCKAKTRFKTL